MKVWTILLTSVILVALLFLQLGQSYSLVNVSSDLTCVSDYQYLPVIAGDYFAGTKELEPNNTSNDANGPLQRGEVYTGELDGQGKSPVFDYYKFYVYQPGDLLIHLIDSQSIKGENLDNNGVQFKLYNVGKNYRSLDLVNDLVKDSYRASEPYLLDTNTNQLETPVNSNASTGWYIIRIAYIPDDAQDPIVPYHLELDFPPFPILPTPSPIPTCAPPTPLPRVLHCPDKFSRGSYVLTFDDQYKIVSNNVTKQFTPFRSTTIPPGDYRVYLASYDDHSEQNEHTRKQLGEKWELVLYDINNYPVITSTASSDLGDNLDCFPEPELVDDHITLMTTIESARGHHSLYFDNSSPNSVIPDYAILEPIK